MARALNQTLLSLPSLQSSCLGLYVTQCLAVLWVLLNRLQSAGTDRCNEADMHVNYDFQRNRQSAAYEKMFLSNDDEDGWKSTWGPDA